MYTCIITDDKGPYCYVRRQWDHNTNQTVSSGQNRVLIHSQNDLWSGELDMLCQLISIPNARHVLLWRNLYNYIVHLLCVAVNWSWLLNWPPAQTTVMVIIFTQWHFDDQIFSLMILEASKRISFACERKCLLSIKPPLEKRYPARVWITRPWWWNFTRNSCHWKCRKEALSFYLCNTMGKQPAEM